MWIVFEGILVTIVVLGALWPYITHLINEKSFKGACYDAGVGYIEIFYQTCKHRFCDMIGTFSLIFMLSSVFEVFAGVMAAYFIHIMIVGKIAIHYGHVPGSIEWN